jgi:gamma-glutamyltranspeptidase
MRISFFHPRTFLICLFSLTIFVGSSSILLLLATPQADVKVTPIVVAADPLAVKVGMDVLKRHGTALDAAVAVQAALGLVEHKAPV